MSQDRRCCCKPSKLASIPRTQPTSSKVLEGCKNLIITDSQAKQIMQKFLDDVKKGLAKKTHENATVKCFMTYVQDLPNGTESGQFLALDLGGTNFRVLLIELKQNFFEMKSKVFVIPQDVMVGTGEKLFDHIAECLAIFVKQVNVSEVVLPLGFTFSFPLKQTGLTKGTLQRWTKGFNCSNVVGKEVVQMLDRAIAKRNDIKILITAILNDTTGTLMSCAWKNHNCKIGVIVGTGSNACYVERQKVCELFDEADRGSGHVIVNTEWGAFGDDGVLDFVRTEFDREVDKNSINPGKQLHEKMISGMYMGELVRLVLQKFTKEGLMFAGKGSKQLFTKDSFLTKYVSKVESEPPGTYQQCKEVLEELQLAHATQDDYINVRYVCECVSRRAAQLVSCGISTLLNKMDEPFVTVGVDGSVYRFHPHFHNLMFESISRLISTKNRFDLMLSEDGSGRGAALVVAVACRSKNK